MHARIELARRCFWDYCRLRAGDFYKPDRPHLVRLCNELQAFSESNEKVMIVCEPPRHGKSRTAGLFTEWLFGRDNTVKVMTGSYNENLSSTFSKGVRNGISEQKADPDVIVYSDLSGNSHQIRRRRYEPLGTGGESFELPCHKPEGDGNGIRCDVAHHRRPYQTGGRGIQRERSGGSLEVVHRHDALPFGGGRENPHHHDAVGQRRLGRACDGAFYRGWRKSPDAG